MARVVQDRIRVKTSNGARALLPGLKQCETRKVKPMKQLTPRPIMTKLQIYNIARKNTGLELTDDECVYLQAVLRHLFKILQDSLITDPNYQIMIFPCFIRMAIKKTRKLKKYS